MVRKSYLGVIALLLLCAAPATSFQAGVAAAVRGKVRMDRAPQVGLVVQSGDPILMGDVIRTDQVGGLQILLLDETVFTLGPDSEMTIDEFVYDPNASGGRIDATLAKGVFRFVTGKVARDEPENVNLKLPEGSIGIRGTIAAARVGDSESIVALLGPGPFNDADERVGGLHVRTPGGSEDLVTPGFGVRLSGTAPPSTPFHVDAADLGFLPALPTGPPLGHFEQNRAIGPHEPWRAAGALRVSGREAGTAPTRVAMRSEAIEALDPSALQGGDSSGLANLAQNTGTLTYPPGMTSVQQLVQFADLFQGRYIWEKRGALLQPPNLGVFDADVVLDFGQRNVSFKFYNFTSTTFLTIASAPGFMTVKPWGNGAGGDAKFVLGGSYFEISSACMPCTVTLDAAFLNKNNLPAAEGKFLVTIDDGGTVAVTPAFQGPPTLVLP
ncbi:MAG: FecR domain-containing protein [bacterium]|nr:FecR domain-containing protein [bacterium]MCP5071290.1 FecR domain-containing protein [bacterium]